MPSNNINNNRREAHDDEPPRKTRKTSKATADTIAKETTKLKVMVAKLFKDPSSTTIDESYRVAFTARVLYVYTQNVFKFNNNASEKSKTRETYLFSCVLAILKRDLNPTRGGDMLRLFREMVIDKSIKPRDMTLYLNVHKHVVMR